MCIECGVARAVPISFAIVRMRGNKAVLTLAVFLETMKALVSGSEPLDAGPYTAMVSVEVVVPAAGHETGRGCTNGRVVGIPRESAQASWFCFFSFSITAFVWKHDSERHGGINSSQLGRADAFPHIGSKKASMADGRRPRAHSQLGTLPSVRLRCRNLRNNMCSFMVNIEQPTSDQAMRRLVSWISGLPTR